MFLISCGGGNARTNTAGSDSASCYGGVYRWNEVQELRSLDPVRLNDAPSHHAVHQMAELLVDFDSSLTLQPELATSWEVTPDGITYSYHIRKGVYFHNSPAFPDGKGREMTPSDVKYCFDRILDAREQTLGASYFLGKVKGAQQYFDATLSGKAGSIPSEGVSGFRVVNDSTFAIDLVQPFAAFKYYPALGFCYIYPHEAVEHFKRDFYRNLVATGPFMLKSWEMGQNLKMVANPNYWGKDSAGRRLPYLSGITISFIKDEKVQLNEFETGRLEESYRIPSESFPQIVTPEQTLTPAWSKYKLHAIAALSTQFYGMLTTSPQFSDKRVRQAFNYAIDRDKIIRYVLLGQAAAPASHGLVPPSVPNYNSKSIRGYTYDIAKARALMAEAGYPNGKGFPATSIQLNSGGGRNNEVAQAIQNMLATGLGIKVGVKILEWPQHQELLETGKAPLFRLGWIADYPDPETFLNLYYGRNVPKSGASPINSQRYVNPEYDSIFARAIATLDDTARYALYAQAEQIAIDDASLLLIYHDLDYRLVQPWVMNYSSNPMDRRDFRSVWLDRSIIPAS